MIREIPAVRGKYEKEEEGTLVDGAHRNEAANEVTPIPLIQLIMGFCGAKTLMAAVELDLFGRVEKAGGLTRQGAVRELGIEDRPADLLLAACASLDLLDKRGDSYVNTPLTQTFLVPDSPHYLGGLIRYVDQRQYPSWHELATALRTNHPVTWDPGVHSSPFETEDPAIMPLFWQTMFSMSTYTGRQLAEALPELAECKSILDIGGGWGAISIEICRRYPIPRATVYDLRSVCNTTVQKIRDAGLGGRIDTAPGDFLIDDDLPTGHEVVVLSSILHDWDEDTNRDILAKCFRALPPGGTIIISEFFLNEQRTGPPQAALIGLTMLIETAGGKNYSCDEYQAWLAEVGFGQIKFVSFDAVGSNGVMVARKP